jgi:hypothetical protein
MAHRHTNYGEPMDARQARYAARAFAEDALRGINRDISQASEEQHSRKMAAAAELEDKLARHANRRIENRGRVDAATARLAVKGINRDITQTREERLEATKARLAAAKLDGRQSKQFVRAFAEDPINRDSTQSSEKHHIPADLRSRLVDESKRRAFEHHYGPQPHWSINDARASTPVKDNKVSAPTNNSLKAVFDLSQNELSSNRAATVVGCPRARAPSPPSNRQNARDSSDVQVFKVPVLSLNDIEMATAHVYAARHGASVPVPAQQMPNGLPSVAHRPVVLRFKGSGKSSQIPVAPSAPKTPSQSTFDKFDGPRVDSDAGYVARSSSKPAAATPITMATPPVNGLEKFQGFSCDLRTPTVAAKPTTITTPTPPEPEDKDYDKLEGLPFGWRKQVPTHSSDDFHVVSGKVPSAGNGSPLHPDTVMDQLDDDSASTLSWDDGGDDTDDEAEWDMGGLSEFKWVGEGSAKVNSTK